MLFFIRSNVKMCALLTYFNISPYTISLVRVGIFVLYTIGLKQVKTYRRCLKNIVNVFCS